MLIFSAKHRKRMAKVMEMLRNDLAHNQPIIESNWEAVALAARRLDRVLTRL